MKPEDRVRLNHMIDAVKEALAFVEGRNRQDLESNRMLVLALIKDIEIVGEAASRITDETRKAYPEIPWNSMIAMRNRLILAYFDVDLDILWQTVTEDLPDLIGRLEAIRG